MSAPAARLTVAAVARRLGVAPATLRTWDRRYGVGPTEHTSGAHRRYTPHDVARLEAMHALVLRGVPAAEAARVALAAAHDAPAPPLAPAPALAPGPLGIPPAVDQAVRGLRRAATSLDAEACLGIVRAQLAEHGVLSTWSAVLLPVLVAVGARWAATGNGVEVEHLLSDCVATGLREHAAGFPPTAPERPVLLACAPGDLHVLPLHALAAGLAEGGSRCRVLGADVPASALGAAVRRTGAAAVFLWSQTAATADPGLLEAVPATRPPTSVVLGGPGWDGLELPSSTVLAPDLGTAVALLGGARAAA